MHIKYRGEKYGQRNEINNYRGCIFNCCCDIPFDYNKIRIFRNTADYCSNIDDDNWIYEKK